MLWYRHWLIDLYKSSLYHVTNSLVPNFKSVAYGGQFSLFYQFYLYDKIERGVVGSTKDVREQFLSSAAMHSQFCSQQHRRFPSFCNLMTCNNPSFFTACHKRCCTIILDCAKVIRQLSVNGTCHITRNAVFTF